MISKTTFLDLKQKFGLFSSFAIWKSSKKVNDISFFDEDEILNSINTNYILVALNPAKHKMNESEILPPFKNFHSDDGRQKDYKLCTALQKTSLWGSYITDLFKSFKDSHSENLEQMIIDEPQNVEEDKKMFLEEIKILTKENKNIVLIALGRKTEKYLKRMFNNEFKILYMTHYSYWGHGYSKPDDYRRKIIEQLKKQNLHIEI